MSMEDGKLEVNGVTYDATADMTYGVPPIEVFT